MVVVIVVDVAVMSPHSRDSVAETALNVWVEPVVITYLLCSAGYSTCVT